MARSLRLMIWNADGLAGKRPELIDFLKTYDVDILLLQETHLGQNSYFTLPNYTIYRTDRPVQLVPCGGTAMAVHRRTPHRHVPLQGLQTAEATSIATPFAGGELCLTSFYKAPTRRLIPPDLDVLLPPNTPSLVGGDFNSKHGDWGCHTPNDSGQRLHHYLRQHPDITVLAPDSPTHIPRNHLYHGDILDMALLRNVPGQASLFAVADLSSDHTPLIVDLDVDPLRIPRALRPKVNWQRYYDHLTARPRPPPAPAATPAELDAQVEDFTSTLQGAIEAATSAPKNKPVVRHVLPQHLAEEVRERRRLRRAWQLSRCPRTREAFNSQSRKVTRLLQDHSEGKWHEFLANQSTQDGSLWRLARSLRGDKRTLRPIHGPNGFVYDSEAKAAVFADSLEMQFSPHEDVIEEDFAEQVTAAVQRFLADPADDGPENLLPAITTEEVGRALYKLRPKKVPGQDRLGAPALRRLPPWVVEFLTQLFNSSLLLRHFPTPWKTARVILIPKPGKNHHFAENHRPISLLPTVSKILEKLIYLRFPEEFHNLLRPEQFGFRRGHSTTLQLARVLESLAQTLVLKQATTATLLDVSKAFDKVWHEGLIYKFLQAPFPKSLTRLLASFLQGRHFVVAVGAATSDVRPVSAGVPQGSVLGPTLYLWYTNDIPITANVKLALYADDALFLARSRRPQQSAVYINRQLTAIEPWLRRWRIKVNAGKSEAVMVTRKVNPCQPPLLLHGTAIPWKTTVKYLGVTIDRKLTMTPHVLSRCRLATTASTLLRPVIGRTSTLTLKTRLMLHRTLIRPMITYAAPAWYHLVSSHHKARLQSVENKILRNVTRSPWYVRGEVIRHAAGFNTLDQHVRELREKMVETGLESQWPHIRDLFSLPQTQLRRVHEPP